MERTALLAKDPLASREQGPGRPPAQVRAQPMPTASTPLPRAPPRRSASTMAARPKPHLYVPLSALALSLRPQRASRA